MLNLLKLKVKVKHLAVEPRIIKETIKHLPGEDKRSFREHIVHVIRPEARATQLAVAYMKGVPYSKIEKSRKPEKEIEFTYVKKRILKMVQSYGSRRTTASDIDEWVDK